MVTVTSGQFVEDKGPIISPRHDKAAAGAHIYAKYAKHNKVHLTSFFIFTRLRTFSILQT